MTLKAAEQVAGDLARQYIEKAKSIPDANRTKTEIQKYSQELADKLNGELDKLGLPIESKIREKAHFIAHNIFYNAGPRWIFAIVYGADDPAYFKRR